MPHNPPNRNLHITVLALLFYIGLFYVLYPIIGNAYMIFSIIPVLLFTWFFNLRHGFLLQVFLVLHRFLALFILEIDYEELFKIGTIIGTSLNFGLLIGLDFVKSLFQRLKNAERSAVCNGNKIKITNRKLIALNEQYLSQNEKLHCAIKKAEESERLKAAFLANMSHEIRTPLNSILGFSDLLDCDDLEPDEHKDFLGHIKRSGNHLLKLVNDIIDISMIEANQLKIKVEECSLNVLLFEIYYTFLPQITKNSNRELSLI